MNQEDIDRLMFGNSYTLETPQGKYRVNPQDVTVTFRKTVCKTVIPNSRAYRVKDCGEVEWLMIGSPLPKQ